MHYFTYGILTVIAAIIVIHIVSALTSDRRIRYTETSWQSPKIPAALNGYVIAFVSDTHELAHDKLRRIVKKVDARQVDLLLLGGDYARKDGFWQTMAILGQTKTKDGVYGVDGNHDNAEKVFAAMRQNGITPLDNEGLYLKPGFYLAGVADLWNRAADVAKAVNNAENDDFVLLVSHNPDVAMRQDTTKVDVLLSGHTHGGIMTFLGLWAPALCLISGYNHKFKGGWTFAPHDTSVFVSRGAGLHKIGCIPIYPRIFSPPQVIYLTLKSQEHEAA